MNQNVPVQNSPVQATPMQSSSHALGYLVGAVVIVVVAGALWYAYSTRTEPALDTETPTATEQTQSAETQSPVSGNSTADISADLDQIDSSSALDAEAAASADSVSGF